MTINNIIILNYLIRIYFFMHFKCKSSLMKILEIHKNNCLIFKKLNVTSVLFFNILPI